MCVLFTAAYLFVFIRFSLSSFTTILLLEDLKKHLYSCGIASRFTRLSPVCLSGSPLLIILARLKKLQLPAKAETEHGNLNVRWSWTERERERENCYFACCYSLFNKKGVYRKGEGFPLCGFAFFWLRRANLVC